MKNSLTLSVVALPILLAGCATYESQPAHHTTVTSYGHGAVSYYSTTPPYYSTPPVYYVAPAPVYVGPPVYVAPAYVAPTPGFSMHMHSGPGLRRDTYPGGSRQRLGSGNAAGSRVGGPGWSGTVWSR